MLGGDSIATQLVRGVETVVVDLESHFNQIRELQFCGRTKLRLSYSAALTRDEILSTSASSTFHTSCLSKGVEGSGEILL